VAEAQDYEEVGFIKYSGEDVEAGVIDAASAGNALIGLDEAIRFFNTRQSPDFANLQYDIPVRTQTGSWMAVVIGTLATGAGIFAGGYTLKAATKMAENDFKDIGFSHVFKKSMAAIYWLARLIRHTRRSKEWKELKLVDQELMADLPAMVKVLNDQGEELAIPYEYFQWYQLMPPRLLVRMTAAIRHDRKLTIGVSPQPNLHLSMDVTEEDKPLFDGAVDEALEPAEDMLFPELQHGQRVRLVGKLSRGNEASNTVGLEYKGHMINCVPASGRVPQYKRALFLRCRVSGQINRHAKDRFVADKRPTLIIDKVEALEQDGQQGLEFDG
jgi:hypothetical protein